MSCAWCHGPIPAGARRDAVYCAQSCRQAAHRFTRAVAHDVRHDGTAAMRFAYADPPYPKLSFRYYRDHPDFAGEVDHEELLGHLSSPGRYDGWALSTSAAALPMVLGLCAALRLEVRVAAWVRGGRSHSHPHGPLSSWEPVVYAGGRDGSQRFDSLIRAARPRTTDPGRVVGAKPATFARWMFELLGAQPGDELDDIFPGSGGITRAWELYTTGPRDASARSRRDTSARALRNVSTGCRSDASPEYSRDTSPSSTNDTSCQDLGDASPLDPHDTSIHPAGHASKSAGADASRSAAARHDTSSQVLDDASVMAIDDGLVA